MSCESNQCIAVGADRSRCKSAAVNGQYCLTHHATSLKFYKKYKELSSSVEKLDLKREFTSHKDRLKYLIKAYTLINSAYLARLKHRRYAVAPECYDRGHNIQFQHLSELILKCERKICKLRLIVEPKHRSDESKSESKSDEDTNVNFNELVETATKKRQKLENDFQFWENLYLKENNQLLQERQTLIFHIANVLIDLFNATKEPPVLLNEMKFGDYIYDEDDFEDENDDPLLRVVIAYNLILSLHYRALYFMKDYKPELCQGCKCGNYNCYDVHLCCSCIKDNNSIFRYLNVMNLESMKVFYGIILMNRDRIRPVVLDAKKFMTIYGTKILWMRFYVMWEPSLKRLVLRENNEEKDDLRGLTTRDRLSERHRIRQENKERYRY